MDKRTPLKAGTLLHDTYVTGALLGEGGFGLTYEAQDRNLKRRVAIKECFCGGYMERAGDGLTVVPAREEYRDWCGRQKESFLKEAVTLASLGHLPGVVQVLGYFEANQTAYMVMERLEGEDLRRYTRVHGTWDPEEIVRRMLPLMQTLGKIHECGVIHRDISPDNIMVTRDGSLVLTDFGAARAMQRDGEMPYPMSRVLKPGFAPPEQSIAGQKQGAYTDVYALSVTLYYCMTGEIPETGLERYYDDTLRTPSGLGCPISAGLESALLRGMDPVPGKRYQTMGEMIRALTAALPQPQEEHRGRAGRILAAVSLAAACLAGGFGIRYLYENRARMYLSRIETETVRLAPLDDVNAADYARTVQVLRERSEVFAGSDRYLLTDEDGTVTLTMPLETYNSCGVDYTLRCYLSRPLNMELMSCEDYMGGTGAEWLSVDRSYIDEAVILRGTVAGCDAQELGLEDAENGYSYIEIRLNEEGAAALHACTSLEEGTALILMYDRTADVSPVYYNYCYTSGDAAVLRLVSTDQEENYLRTLQWNLAHGTFEEPLTFTAQLAADWEATAGSILSGEHQCDVTELDGDLVTLQFGPRSTGLSYEQYKENNKAGWVQMGLVLRQRLDSLRVPYAFGYSRWDDHCFMVCMQREDLLAAEAQIMMNSDYLVVRTRWGTVDLYVRDDNGAFSLDEEGRLVLNASQTLQDDLAEQSALAMEAGDTYLQLYSDDVRLAVMTLNGPIEDGVLVFDEICIGDPDSPGTAGSGSSGDPKDTEDTEDTVNTGGAGEKDDTADEDTGPAWLPGLLREMMLEDYDWDAPDYIWTDCETTGADGSILWDVQPDGWSTPEEVPEITARIEALSGVVTKREDEQEGVSLTAVFGGFGYEELADAALKYTQQICEGSTELAEGRIRELWIEYRADGADGSRRARFLLTKSDADHEMQMCIYTYADTEKGRQDLKAQLEELTGENEFYRNHPLWLSKLLYG